MYVLQSCERPCLRVQQWFDGLKHMKFVPVVLCGQNGIGVAQRVACGRAEKSFIVH